MALIKCKECGANVSSKAENCPSCGIKLASKNGGRSFVFAVVIFVSIVLLWLQNDESKKAIDSKANTDKTAETITAGQPKEAVNNEAALPPESEMEKQLEGKAWIYLNRMDQMTDTPEYTAAILSKNTVNFKWPYSGEQRARLILRTAPKTGKDVIFQIDKGQFLCPPGSGCKVDVRFDDGSVITYEANPPGDYKKTTIFISGYEGFIDKLMKAKTVRLSTNIYQESNPVFVFDVQGFNHDSYTGKAVAID